MGSAAKALRAFRKDMLRCPIGIVLNLVVPKPQHEPALLLKEDGPTLVVLIRCLRVLASIQLDRELCCATRKIDDERLDDELTREAWPILPKAQPQ